MVLACSNDAIRDMNLVDMRDHPASTVAFSAVACADAGCSYETVKGRRGAYLC